MGSVKFDSLIYHPTSHEPSFPVGAGVFVSGFSDEHSFTLLGMYGHCFSSALPVFPSPAHACRGVWLWHTSYKLLAFLFKPPHVCMHVCVRSTWLDFWYKGVDVLLSVSPHHESFLFKPPHVYSLHFRDMWT